MKIMRYDAQALTTELLLGNTAEMAIALVYAIAAQATGGLTDNQLAVLQKKIADDLSQYMSKEAAKQLAFDAMARNGESLEGFYKALEWAFKEA
jgi:hypothetical protein